MKGEIMEDKPEGRPPVDVCQHRLFHFHSYTERRSWDRPPIVVGVRICTRCGKVKRDGTEPWVYLTDCLT